MTRQLDSRLSFGTLEASPQWGTLAGAAGSSYGSFGSDGWSTQQWPALNYANLYIPPMSGRISLSFHWAVPITVAGVLRVVNPYNTAEPFADDITLPVVAASGTLNVEVDIPTYMPTCLTWQNIPQSAGPVNLASLRTGLIYVRD